MEKILFLIVRIFRKIERVMFDFFQGFINKAYLKYHGASFDSQSIVFHGKCTLKIGKGSQVSIGKNFVCWGGVERNIDNRTQSRINVKMGACLIIGCYSGISNTSINCNKNVSIGNYVKIGAGCIISDEAWTKDEDYNNSAKIQGLTIDDNVFIGARSTIKKNVRIGAKSIISAGSVVCCDIPEDEIWGGNPARFIKKIPYYKE